MGVNTSMFCSIRKKTMSKKVLKRIGLATLILFIIGNFIVYNHVYRFTHFSDNVKNKTKKPEKLSILEKLNTVFMGIRIPKPKNEAKPIRNYETFTIKSKEDLEAWHIEIPEDKGIVIMFHGYSSSKSNLLEYSEEFNKKGYSTLLVDFMGSGGSTGNMTTIGFEESKDVKAAYELIKIKYPNKEIVLFGCSMGAASIMKSIKDYEINPDKIILECPFGSFEETTKKRFQAMNLPSFPFTDLLMIHGRIQLGFNPYTHNAIEYVKKIKVPTLLLIGRKDERVSMNSIEKIYQNLNGTKELGIMENSEHEVYLNDDSEEWHKFVDNFLKNKN